MALFVGTGHRLRDFARRGRKRSRRAAERIRLGVASPSSGAGAPPGDPRLSLDLAEIGAGVSYFLTAESADYIRRNVETIQIKTASFARRRLTVDVQLPSDPELGLPEPDGRRLFWVPITSITKRPPRANIDLCDDHGRVVPLLTRQENGAISLAAIQAAAEELLGGPPAPLLADLLPELIEQDGIKGDVSFLLAKVALEEAGVDVGAGPGLAFVEALRFLSGNSWVWVAIRGRPGERRVIKFHYDVELRRVRLRRKLPAKRRYLVYAEQTKVVYRLDVPERGDGNPYSPLRRLASRVVLAIGLAAIDFGIESPYLSGSSAYHLQVESPPGVETRDIRLLAELAPGAHLESRQRSHGVHLYLTGARLAKDGRSGLAIVALRVGRRGFMTLSWLTAMITAALLWLFDVADHVASREATAAVMLIGPALLTALVVRPGEHPVATKLLSGVRVLVALNGMLAVAAAAAVAGVKPSAWSLEHTWFVYAVLASVVAGILSLSWLLSWDTTDALAKGLRRWWKHPLAYRCSCAALIALAAAVLCLGDRGADLGLAISRGAYLAALLVICAAAGFAAASYARLDLPSSAWLSWAAVYLVSLATVAGALAMAMSLVHGWSWQPAWRGLGALALLCLFALLVQALYLAWRGPARPPAPLPATEDA